MLNCGSPAEMVLSSMEDRYGTQMRRATDGCSCEQEYLWGGKSVRRSSRPASRQITSMAEHYKCGRANFRDGIEVKCHSHKMAATFRNVMKRGVYV
jgi:hypothetical protein